MHTPWKHAQWAQMGSPSISHAKQHSRASVVLGMGPGPHSDRQASTPPTELHPQALGLFSVVQAGFELLNSPASTLSLPRTGVYHHPEL